MPLPEIAFDGENLSIPERLRRFVQGARRVLSLTLEDEMFAPAFESNTRRRLSAAVAETQPHFDALEVAVDRIGPSEIVRHGLAGAQLSAKTSLVANLWERLRHRFDPHLTRRVLDAVHVLIDSILEATRAGTAIKEAIGLVSIAVEDSLVPLPQGERRDFPPGFTPRTPAA